MCNDPCNFSDLPEEYAQAVENGAMTVREAYHAWQASLSESRD